MDGLRDWQPPPPGLTYDPWMFDVTTLDAAKRIILTPASGIDTEQRWSTETPYLADLVDRTLHLDERSLVLDYGCGVGRLSKELIARYGCRVVGVDISTGMRTLAVQYVDSDRFFACGPDGLDSLVAHGTLFDLAVAVWVLQHCGNVTEDIERIVRALAPTGRLFVVNEKGRLVPTAGTDWANDGIDVLTLLRENLAEEAHGSLSTDHVAELLTRCAYWSTFRAGPPAKEPLDA